MSDSSWRAAVEDGVLFATAPDDLGVEDLDPAMRPIVAQINRSGWAWTRYCCEGHWEDGEWTSIPYIQFVCRKQDFLKAARIVAETLEDAQREGWPAGGGFDFRWLSPGWCACTLRLFDAPDDASPVDVALRASRLFQRFADRVASS